MTEEEKREQQKANEAHLAAAEANKNAQYIDLAETNRKLNAEKKAATLGKRRMGGD